MNTINTINVAALKTSLCHFLHDVERGKEFVVTSHRQPVAKIIPYEPIVVKKSLKPANNLRKIKGIKLKTECDPVALLLNDRGMR